MKGLFKLTTAALALVTFASCSDDLFEKDGLFGDASKKGALEVTVEDMVEPISTRSIAIDERSTDGKKNVLLWEDGDNITVWNKDLTRYDYYEFSEKGGAFALPAGETAYVDEPTFALFNYVTYFTSNPGWRRETNTTTIDMRIPSIINYGEEDADGELAYLSTLPMWGTAEKDGETVKASLGYMTAILKIKLANVPGNAKTLVVKAYKDVSASKPAQLTGDFRATVAKGNTVNSTAALEVINANAANANNNYIWVDLSDVTSKQSVIYIPIVAGKYGKLQVYTTTNAITYPDGDGAPTLTEGTNTLVKAYTSKEFVRGKVYAPTSDLFKEVGGATPSAISASLATMLTDANDLTLTTSQTTDIITANAAAGVAEDATIKIPGGMATKKITFDLKGIKADGDIKTLNLDDDDFEPFEGDVILKIAANTGVTAINVDLPKANVVIVSDKIKLAACNITVNQAGSLTIGDGEAATAVKNITFNGTTPKSDFISVNTGATAGDITAAAGQVNTIKVGAGATASTITANVANLDGDGDVAVEITGSTDATKPTTITTLKVGAANGYDLEIPANTTVPTVTSTKGDVSIAGTAGTVTVTDGDVTVNRATEGVAISTALNIGATGKILTLSGGYIESIAKAGETAIAKLTIDNTETIQTGIKSISDGDFTEVAIASTWAGKTITTTGTGNFAAYANQAGIYTASQFASYVDNTTSGTKLYADIDLGTNAFTPVGALTKAFDGNKKTIKGGVVTYKATKAADPATAYVGLFKTVAADVKNLTIDGLSITAETVKIGDATKTAVVGALAGQATNGTITNVNVKNVTLTSDALKVGGLFGDITAGDNTVTIAGANQGTTGTFDHFSTVTASITGKNNLGGIVGCVTSGTVEIKDYKAVPTFAITTQTVDGRSADTNFGTIAPFVGTAAAGIITIGNGTNGTEGADDGYKATAALTDTQRTDLNFKANWVKVTGTPDVYFDFYGRKAIGFVAATSGVTVKIASDNAAKMEDNQKADTAAVAATAAAAVSSTDAALNIFVKE